MSDQNLCATLREINSPRKQSPFRGVLTYYIKILDLAQISNVDFL